MIAATKKNHKRLKVSLCEMSTLVQQATNTMTTSLDTLGLSVPQQVLVGSVALHLFLYLFLMKILCKTIFLPNIYNSLKKKHQDEYESRIISSIHSFILAFGGLYVLINDSKFYWDWDIHQKSQLTECLFYYSTGYMFVDLMFVLYYYPQIGGIEMVIHHIFISLAQIVLVEFKTSEVIGVWVTQTEHTTAFINLRWFLDVSGGKASVWYVANGLMMWLTWLVFRMGYALWCLLFFIYKWDDWMKLVEQPDSNGWFHLIFFIVQTLNLALLNSMWFYKLTRGVIKALFSKKDKSA